MVFLIPNFVGIKVGIEAQLRIYLEMPRNSKNNLSRQMTIMFCFSFKFRAFNGMMVTCSKDRSIAVWDMVSPTEINLRR